MGCMQGQGLSPAGLDGPRTGWGSSRTPPGGVANCTIVAAVPGTPPQTSEAVASRRRAGLRILERGRRCAESNRIAHIHLCPQ